MSERISGEKERLVASAYAQGMTVREAADYAGISVGAAQGIIQESRTRCGNVDRRNRPERNLFRCIKCGFSDETDYVAALNIAKKAVFNQPIVAPSLNEAYEVVAISHPSGGRS